MTTDRGWCWCCAVWGLSTPADIRRKDNSGYIYICKRCDNSSPTACKNRHIAEALKAAKR